MKREIKNFVYFSFNYPPRFTYLVWKDKVLAKHLHDKFIGIYEQQGSKAAMIQFYSELSDNNQQILEDYIINQFKL